MSDSTEPAPTVDQHLAAIVPEELLEIRVLTPPDEQGGQEPVGRARRFLPMPTCNRDAVGHATEMARYFDVYAGCAPREPAPDGQKQKGDKEAVSKVNALWADLDDDDGLDSLGRAAMGGLPLPSALVASGSLTSSGRAKLHAYWYLAEPVAAAEAGHLLKHLAAALHGDAKAAEVARVLRFPGTLNHKLDHAGEPPRPVEIVGGTGQHHAVEKLGRALGEIAPAPPAASRPPAPIQHSGEANGRVILPPAALGQILDDAITKGGGSSHNTLKHGLERARRYGLNAQQLEGVAAAIHGAHRARDPRTRELPNDEIDSAVKWTACNVEVDPRKVAQAQQGASEPARVVTARAASTVRPEQTRFLDPQRMVPLGALSMTVGDPGVSKSTLACYRAACVSSGRGGWTPGAVLIVTGEDSIAATLVPRLRAVGADLERVHFVEARADGQPDGIRLPDDVAALRELVEEHGAVYVVIDPLSAHLPSEINSWRDQDVRRALAPMATLAEDCGCCVDVIAHLNKARGQDPIYRVAGSIGTVGAARSVVLVTEYQEENGDDEEAEGKEEQEDTTTLRVASHVKCNVGPRQPAVVYEIEPATIEGEAGQRIETSRLVYRRRSNHQAADLLDPPKRPPETKSDAVRELLLDALSDGQPHESSTIKERIIAVVGCGRRTVERVAEGLGNLEIVNTDETPRRTMWKLREPFSARSDSRAKAPDETPAASRANRSGATSEPRTWRDCKTPVIAGDSANEGVSGAISHDMARLEESASHANPSDMARLTDNPFLIAQQNGHRPHAEDQAAASDNDHGPVPGYQHLRIEDFAR